MVWSRTPATAGRSPHSRLLVAPRPAQPWRLRLVDLLATHWDAVPSLSALLGLADSGRSLLARLDAPAVNHMFVIGDQGTGKSSLLRTIVLSLALTNSQRHLQMALFDPCNGLASLSGLPHLLTPAVTDPDSAVEVLDYLVESCGRRTAAPRILVVLDDMEQWGDEIVLWVSELARYGPRAGVQLVGSLSRPAGLLWQEVDWSQSLGLIGRLARRDDQQAAGVEHVDLGQLGTGEWVAVTQREEAPFRAAHVSDELADELVAGLWDRPGRQLLARWMGTSDGIPRTGR